MGWQDAPVVGASGAGSSWQNAPLVEPDQAAPDFFSMAGLKSDLQAIPGRLGNLAAGAVRGAGSIGATGMRVLPNWLGGDTAQENAQRRTDMDSALQSMGADPTSLQFGVGKLGAEIAGTAGAGNLLVAPLRAVQAINASRAGNAIATGLETGGFRAGGATGLPGALVRAGTGAATGGAAAGMVNPEDAGTGALIGGALPAGVQLAGKVGTVARNALGGGSVTDEVRSLAQRAAQLGIDVPADRLVNSRPLNAVASSLNYVPFSGRAATEDRMVSQLNQALSRTFGQNQSNVTLALRKAETDLGGKFETTLSQNGVQFDQPLLEGLASVYNKAEQELGSDALKPIASKINEIVQKGQNGVIDGQAAYNIKRDLDRLGNMNNPTAYHAIELKRALLDALNRSLGPEKAAAFAQTRQQYSTMLDLQKLAKNGAEGEVSAARLANMQKINNPDLQELADIAAQFVKGREGAHGAAQRVMGAGGTVGAATLGAMGLPGAAAAAIGAGTMMAGGRATNSLLNSPMTRQFLLGGNLAGEPPAMSLLTQGAYRALPLTPSLLTE